jgi:predicted ATPase/DNA-binding SARP family transcriptional activator
VHVQVAMLGALEVRADSGELLEVGGSRLRALLIMLALRPGQVVPASELIDGLWADQAPAGAANALQALVSRLRRALPEARIESRPSGYQLTLDPRATDITRFEELAAAGRSQLRHDPAAAAATLRQALALWRGPALADVAGTEFGPAIIARLDELRLAAIEQRVDADLLTGVTGPLVAELEELVVAHPLREPLAARLMRALHACGRRGAALEAYEQARERLADQLGADPSAELSALHLDILRADPRPAAQARPTNLPAGLTSFIGRDDELTQVAGLLGAHRLLTLTGPGGAGKTRLAVEAARAELDAAPGGVWLVELAPVTDPAEVPSAVLAALGLREQALMYARGPIGTVIDDTDALSRLLAALAGRRALLVLDNCEHLVAAAARLSGQVLAACPHVRILATSREPLAITGEALWTVGPLTLPPDPAVPYQADQTHSAERAGVPAPAIDDYASVRLLTQRARAVRPGFDVTAANAPAVARICRALDGMPLAIELAAARLRTMGPDQVAARLDDRFGLLTGGSRIAMPRHQTLRAVVDWSWDLLDEAERTVWRRFSCFAGGATLEAAEQVCSGDGIAADQILDLLTALADKSLLVVRHGPDGPGEPRYRMLEIIKAYGQERLDQAGERDQVREAHAQYFTGLAEEGQYYLLGGQQLEWLRRLAEDQDNMHAAIRGAIAAGDASAAVRLAAALGWYWSLHGLKVEGAELIAAAVGVPGAAGIVEPEHLAVAYAMGGVLAADTPLHPNAVEWMARAAALAPRIPDPVNPIMPLVGPLSLLYGGADQAPGTAYPEVFDDAVSDSHPWVGAIARILRAHTSLNLGRPPALAEADFQAAADILAGLGERWGQAVAVGGLAQLASKRGDSAAAIRYYRRAGELAAVFGNNEDEVHFRLFLVRELWLLGEREKAWAELHAALPDAERIGLPELTAFAAYTKGDLARLDGQPGVAREAFLQAFELIKPMGITQQLGAVAAIGLGYLAAAEGDLEEARDWHARAMENARASADAPVIAEALGGLADLALREGDPERAAALIGAGVAIRGTPDRSVVDEKRVADAARSVLGEAGYGAAYQRGQRVTLDTLAALVAPGVTPGAGTPAPRAGRTPP